MFISNTDTWFCHSHWLWRLFVHCDLELDPEDIFSIVLWFIFSNSLFYYYLNQCFNSRRRNWIVFWCSSATCQFREKQKMSFVLHVSFAKKKYRSMMSLHCRSCLYEVSWWGFFWASLGNLLKCTYQNGSPACRKNVQLFFGLLSKLQK